MASTESSISRSLARWRSRKRCCASRFFSRTAASLAAAAPSAGGGSRARGRPAPAPAPPCAWAGPPGLAGGRQPSPSAEGDGVGPPCGPAPPPPGPGPSMPAGAAGWGLAWRRACWRSLGHRRAAPTAFREPPAPGPGWAGGRATAGGRGQRPTSQAGRLWPGAGARGDVRADDGALMRWPHPAGGARSLRQAEPGHQSACGGAAHQHGWRAGCRRARRAGCSPRPYGCRWRQAPCQTGTAPACLPPPAAGPSVAAPGLTVTGRQEPSRGHSREAGAAPAGCAGTPRPSHLTRLPSRDSRRSQSPWYPDPNRL